MSAHAALSATGRRIRRAARLLVLDEVDRLLLFRFTFEGRRPFWATPGGECDPGEDWAEAARRELLEETGIDADPGPIIAARSNDFTTVDGEPVTADERWFRVRVNLAAHGGTISTTGHTAHERQIMQDHRWFTRAELDDPREPVWPPDIASLLD